MKVEIEIDEQLRARLLAGEWECVAAKDDVTAVKIAAERRLREYAHRPETVSEKHLAALAIVRAQAAANAAQAGVGRNLTSVASEADMLLDFILGSR